MFDLNDAPPQRDNEPIPDGTFVKLVMGIRPGAFTLVDEKGERLLDPMDDGLLRASNSSDASMIDCEFTVAGGQYDTRKVFQMYTVAGGTLDEKGNSKAWSITKSTLRAIIESAIGLDPGDMSEKAKASRKFQGFKQLDGIEFYARLDVEPGQPIIDKATGQPTGRNYPPKNVIGRVLTVKDAEYAALRAGQDVAAKPKGSAPAAAGNGRAAAASSAQPAWAKATPSDPTLAKAMGVPASAPKPAPAAPAPVKGPAWLNT
jgi:hypothetical protein